MTNGTDKNIAVVYHADCRDGFSGAWVAWKKFGNQAEYIPLGHGDEPPRLSEREVYLIDILPEENELKNIIRLNKSVFAIDHHVSNKQLLSMVSRFKFQVDKSAAVLAWEHFFPNQKIPALLNYVQDMDLFEWDSRSSMDVFSYINFLDHDFNIWNQLADDLENPEIIVNITQKGALLNAYKEKKINEIIEKNARLVRFEGLEIFAANSSTLRSPLADRLIKRHPPIALIWVETKDKIQVSLRSNVTVDVSVLAKKFGGGGHPLAAGFRLPLGTPRPWRVVY